MNSTACFERGLQTIPMKVVSLTGSGPGQVRISNSEGRKTVAISRVQRASTTLEFSAAGAAPRLEHAKAEWRKKAVEFVKK